MKIMPCPLNGNRNISEFVCGGEVKSMPHPADANDDAWADYLYLENNTMGVVTEWWLHVASGYWFIAERNTATDEIIRTYPARERFNARVEFQESQS